MAQKGQQEIRAQGACRKNTQKRRSIRHLAARGEFFPWRLHLVQLKHTARQKFTTAQR